MIAITNEQIERVNNILVGINGAAEKVISRAIEAGKKTANTYVNKGIKEVYDIKTATLKKHGKVDLRTNKTGDVIVGEVSFSGYKIPLYKFKATPTRPSKRVVKAHQMKSNAMTPFAEAFIADMPTGHTGIFERKNKDRYPIKEIMGSSLGQMAANADIVENVEKKVQERINERIEHGINHFLSKNGGK